MHYNAFNVKSWVSQNYLFFQRTRPLGMIYRRKPSETDFSNLKVALTHLMLTLQKIPEIAILGYFYVRRIHFSCFPFFIMPKAIGKGSNGIITNPTPCRIALSVSPCVRDIFLSLLMCVRAS